MATSDASPASPRSPRAQEVPQTDALRTEAETLFKDEMSTLEHSYRTTLLELFYWRRGHSQSESSPPTADLASMDWDQLDQSHDFTTFAAAHPLQPTSSDDDTAMEMIIPKIEELEAVSTSEKADETPTLIPPFVSKVIQSMPVTRYRERPAHPKKTRIIPYGKRTKSRHQRKQAIQRTLELYAWQYKVQQQPLFKVLPSARKFVPTSHWRVARDELKSFRALQRVEVLKNQNQWSFRQLEKHEAPTRTKTHWDYLLDEMQWLQADFKEERRWKIAMAYQVSQWVMEWHQSTDKSALCVKSTIPSLQVSHTLVKPAAQPSGILPKPLTTPMGDPLNRENWLQCLDPNSGLVLDDQLSQEIMAHYYEYPLFVPPIYDEQAQYEDLLEHGQTVPISALMSTMVAFDPHQPPTTTWADQPLQTVPQKRTADPLDEYLAVLDKESAALAAGDSERLTLADKPSEAQDMLDHPNDYCLADNEYTTFSTTMFDGGYPGDHTVHQLTKTARPLPGIQLYHGQHVISPLFAHQKSQDGHNLSPALTVQTSPPEVPATVDAAMWTSEAEALLQELVDQYGPYWDLVSDALNASDHIPGSTPRNARDCYDRWNMINHALARPVDRRLIPSTPLSATSTLVAGEHGQATPEIQTMGADEKRGQRLQSFTDAIRKTSKRRQETQQRMQQTLATRSKKLGSFKMASAPDANGTEGNAEPSKTIITPGEAGSDATKPATDDKGASSMTIPQVPYRSPLELGVAKQELDAQMAQLALRRQRSFNTTQWTMHNLARSMMGRSMGIPMVNRPMMPPRGLTPVRPGMGMSLPGALPTAAGMPPNVTSEVPVDSNPMATANLGSSSGGISGPPPGATPPGSVSRNPAGVNPAVARGIPQLAGIPAHLAARLTPEQLQMMMLTRQAQLIRQAAALQAAQGGAPATPGGFNPPNMQATAPNTSGPPGQQQPGLAMSLPGMMTPSPGLPTSSSSSLHPNVSSSPMTSPTTGAATVTMVSPSRGGASPKTSVAKTPRSVASPLSNKKSLGSPQTPSSTHTPRKQTSVEPKSPDTPQKLALQSPTTGLKTMGNPAELVTATTGAGNSLGNVPQNPANLSMLAAQLANLTPVQKLKLLRQHQHYQQLLQQAHVSEGFKQQIQQAQQQTQAQLRQHLQRAQLLQQQQQQQQQRAGQSGGANPVAGNVVSRADSSGTPAPGVESGTKPQDRPSSAHGSPNPAGSSSNTRTFPANSRALGLSSPNMAPGLGMGNLNSISSAEFLAAFEKHKQQHPGFNADKLRMQMLQQHLAMTAQAQAQVQAQSQQANPGGTSLLNTASPGMTAANTLINNSRPPNPQSPVMTAQSTVMTASPRHPMRPMVSPMGMMPNTPGGPRMRPTTAMMGSPPLTGNTGGQNNLMNNANFAAVGLPANSLGLAASGIHGLPHHQFMMAHQPSPHGHLHGSPGVPVLPHTPPARPANLPNIGGSPSHPHQSLAQTAYMSNPNVNVMPPGNNPALGLGPVGVGRPNTAAGGATPNFSALQAALFANNPAAVQNMMQALANVQRSNAMAGVPIALSTGMNPNLNPNVMAAMAAAAQNNAKSGNNSGGNIKTTAAPNVANLGTAGGATDTPSVAVKSFANPHFSPRPQPVVSGVSTPVGSAGPSPKQPPPPSLPVTSSVSGATMSHPLTTTTNSSPKVDPKLPTQVVASPVKAPSAQPADTTKRSDKTDETSNDLSTAGD